MIPNLQVGQKLTLVWIDDMMALTHRQEIEVRSVIEPIKVGYEGKNTRVGTYRVRGKRKEFFLDLKLDTLVFDCWDVPFKADTEDSSCFSGNACFNLVGDPAVIREWVDTRQLNSGVGDQAKAKILVWPAKERDSLTIGEGTLLYPEIDTHHAVINRIKEKLMS
jgi:hypothetical protein